MIKRLWLLIKNGYKEFLLIVEFSCLISFLIFNINTDLSLITLLFFLITLSLVVSTYVSIKKYRLILRFGAAVIFLHFLLIPTLCLFLLQQNSESFKFETEVVKSEEAISIENNEKKFTPKQLTEEKRILITLINSNSINTTRQLVNLNNNLISIDSFHIFKRGRSGIVVDHPATVYEYVISNFEGNFILILPAIKNEQTTIKDFLQSVYKELLTKENDYKQSSVNIRTGKFWTFSQIISYTITFSDMKPISRAANWIYWLHYFVVVGFFISFLSNLFRPDIPKNN